MHPTFARVWSPLALLLVLLRPDPIVPPLQALDRTRAADLRQGYDEYAARRRISPSAFLSWSYLGPTNLSGRSTDVAVAEVDGRRRLYVGYATSGVWRSDDNGTTWRAVFENEASTSIGDLAVAPSRPDTIWVGTGESNIYRASMPGVGVYKSTDGGLHWQHMGLDDTQTIARIVVHPSNPDVVYVAASGHEWTDNDARGVYKTTDGGRTWTRVLFASRRTGAIDLVMDPRDPDTLYAALWQRIRRKWSDPRVEPGYRESAVVKTTDGGRTWTDASHGLPAPADRGRIGLDISRSHPDTLYAFVDNYHVRRRANPGERDVYGRSIAPGQGLLTGADVYRSDDAGRTWRRTSRADAATRRTLDHQSETFGWVFGQIRVDPTDAGVVYILGVPLSVSHDGGRSFTEIEGPTRSNVDGRPTGRLHHDHHGLWIDPDDPAVLYDCNDGGFYTSSDAGRTWDYAVSAGGVEFYDVALDTSTPAWAYGSIQDQGSWRGRVTPAPDGSGFAAVAFQEAPGGEASRHAIDPDRPDVVYADESYGTFARTDLDGRPHAVTAIRPPDTGLRAAWLAPIIVSPHDPRTIYAGYQFVFRSRTRGDDWERISPDLTDHDPSHLGQPPWAIPYQTIVELAESPRRAGLLYAGTDDGRLQVTADGGSTWTDLTASLPARHRVSRIVASRFDDGTVYVTLRGREDDDFTPWIDVSSDFGRTFRSLAADLPAGSVNVIREDPRSPEVLYAGTDFGVFVSLTGGRNWQVLGGNLPSVQVSDLQLSARDHTIVAATYGRGLWALDVGRLVVP